MHPQIGAVHIHTSELLLKSILPDKNLVKTKLPDGPGDKLGHWRMSFGHEEDDGKGPKA